MDEHTGILESTKLMKSRKELRIVAAASLGLGIGFILVVIGIFVFFSDFLAKARLNPQTKDLAKALWSFTLLLIPCNAMTIIMAVCTLRYLHAERKSIAKPSAT